MRKSGLHQEEEITDPDAGQLKAATVKKILFEIVLPLLALLILVWVAHYFNFRNLGLYEDDYAQISPPLGWDRSNLLDYLKWVLTWPQGRPLQYLFTGVLGFIGARLGGLPADYILAYLIQSTNTILAFFLLRKIGLRKMAWVGVLVLVLFPADTTHTFLMHAFGLHTSLMFILAASLLFLNGRRFWSYLFSFLALITYESTYPIFLLVPLLNLNWGRGTFKKWFRHALVWLGILLIVIILRVSFGETRMVTTVNDFSGLPVVIWQTLQSLVIGPAFSLWSFIYGPNYTLTHWQSSLYIVAIITIPIVLILLALSLGRDKLLVFFSKGKNYLKDRVMNEQELSKKGLLRLIILSLILLAAAYLFSFTHFPPTALFGRITSVHLAAAFGSMLLVSSLITLGLVKTHNRWVKIATVVLLVLYMPLLMAYRYSIQLDFVKAWANQQTFWSQLVDQVPDMGDGTVVVVMEDDLPKTHYIITNSWADPIVLRQIFWFPAGWQSNPRALVFHSDWLDERFRMNSSGEWEIFFEIWEPHWEVLPENKLVLLKMEDGQLTRQFGALKIDGNTLQLKPLDLLTDTKLQPGPLYPYLIQSNN